MITVLVTGGRRYNDQAKVDAVLDRVLRDNPGMRLIHGGCGDDADIPKHVYEGADACAHDWAMRRHVPTRVYPARWSVLGKPAGPERNARMLRYEPVSLGIAFKGGPGTANCVQLIRSYDLPLIYVGI